MIRPFRFCMFAPPPPHSKASLVTGNHGASFITFFAGFLFEDRKLKFSPFRSDQGFSDPDQARGHKVPEDLVREPKV